jgi:SAM-dependent methyltransferase
MADAMRVFDRRVVRIHRDRAAATLAEHDFLFRDVGERLVDRLADVRRRFPLALDLGCRDGLVQRLLAGRGGIERMVHCDLSSRMVASVPDLAVVADEEALPFAIGSFDLVLSLLDLHWVNDLPGTLLQIRRVLKPDGLFLAAMFGGQTLHELRHALTEAEIAVEGGVSPRVAPFADVRDAGQLLQRAGFALPVADVDTIEVSYPNPLALLVDLRRMGESNAVLERRKAMSRRATLFTAIRRYEERFTNAEGRVPATFEVLYLHGWAPAPSQPKPLRPNSATMRLADALDAAEVPAEKQREPER